jgi:hypothetical protein
VLTHRVAAGVVAALIFSLAGLLACAGDDDDASPTDAATPTPAPSVATGLACELLNLADLESVTGPIFTQQPVEPDEFESCFAFVNGGQVIIEACRCLSDEEFDERVEAAARGYGTEVEDVADVGEIAAWVPAGENDPNNGTLWAKSGDLTVNLWLNLLEYGEDQDDSRALAETVGLVEQILAAQ